jgi:capsular polysaccharide biosynthesis protein
VNEADNNHDYREPAQLTSLSADDVRERLWAYEDFTTAEEHPPFDVAGSFVSLGFIAAAVRRTRKFWLAWAVVGIVAGLAIYVKYPVSYSATVKVLIKPNPGEDAVSAMQTEIQLVESQTVAAGTIKALGLTQSVSSLQDAYTATAVTNEILSITLSAPTGPGALARANEIAAQYLSFRASMLGAQQTKDIAAYAAQVPAAQRQIASLQSQISQLRQQGGQGGQLTKLQNQLTTATNALPELEQTVTGMIAQEKSTTSSMIDGSQVLDAATLAHHSKLKDLVEYLLAGVIGGLAIGLGIVVVRELTSDRLRRRDDIAAALGGPVRLSIGPVATSPLPLGGPSAAVRNHNLQRLSAYLRRAVSWPKQPTAGYSETGYPVATLAVVAVDNAYEIAPAVAMVAERHVKDGERVVVADLVKGTPVARLLGEGTGPQSALSVVTAKADDLVPAGPFGSAAAPGPLATPPSAALVDAVQQADLLLTFVELDPAVGAEHLCTFAEAAVVVFTAGRSRAERAYAVGEMLRLSGVRTVSGALVGADKTDGSLGLAPALAVTTTTAPEESKPAFKEEL